MNDDVPGHDRTLNNDSSQDFRNTLLSYFMAIHYVNITKVHFSVRFYFQKKIRYGLRYSFTIRRRFWTIPKEADGNHIPSAGFQYLWWTSQ